MAIKRAVFFTIDGLLASGIIIVTILLVSTFYSANQQPVNINYASRDLVRIFSTLTVGEVNNDYVKSLIASGDIANLNNTILGQIGSFWAEDKMELANNFTKNLTEDIFPSAFGFSILVDDDLIYSRNLPIKRSLVSSRKVISGIAKAKPTEGFTARVLLNGIKSKKTNAYVYFGGYEGDGNLTKKLILPNDVISFNNSYLEVDAGGNFTLYINNFKSGDYIKGSAGGGDMLADKWNLSGNNLSFFKPGENNITVKFTSGKSYIAGGFLSVTYITSSFNDTQSPGHDKSFLPGIDGVINLYSSLFFPNSLTNMSVYLHFTSKHPLYVTIGNSTVFESTESDDEQIIKLNSSNISASLENSSLSFGFLSGKTVPFRVGLRESGLRIGGADAVLITDRTSKMAKCDVPADCSSPGLCDANPNGGCHMRRIDAAADSDRKFINVVLSDDNKNNKVALVGFGFDANPVCDIHDFSQDNLSLSNRIRYYKKSSWCGQTCISCSIYSATQLLTEKETLYGFKEIFANEPTEYKLGVNNFNALTVYFNKTINPLNLIKARVSVFGNKVESDKGFQDCVYFNGHYLGRVCETNFAKLDYHSCYYSLKPEWFNLDNFNKNNITVTGGTKTSCFGGSGAEDVWNVTDISLIAWEADSIPNALYNATYDSLNFVNGIELNRTNITIATYMNISDVVHLQGNKTRVRAAQLEFEAANGTPKNFNCIYINGNYLGRVDWQEWNSTEDNVWQKVLFDVPAVWLRNGTNEINLTSGTDKDCKGPPGSTHVPWRFRNLSLLAVWLDQTVKYDRHKSMLVMSSGKATEMIDRRDAAAADARQETIDEACEAHKLYNISIYTVATGDAGDAPTEMLNATACCDNCSNYYRAESQQELLDAYGQIAEKISAVEFEEGSQSAIAGGGFERTTLFPDSYIDFNYTYNPQLFFNNLPISFETDRFGNTISSGTLTIYPNTSFAEGKATSYSGDKWTDKMLVNNSIVFQLSDYGNYSSDDPTLTKIYKHIGDPFIVNIPSGLIDEGLYNITVSTGVNSTNPTNGSADNRLIYTLLIKSFSDYSGVVAKSDGCSWTVSFEDGTGAIIKVPPSYGGADICSFLAGTYDVNDALDNSVYQLFSNLDIDKDGKLDVNIDENNLNINTLTLSKVPSLWGPAIVEIRVWE